MRNYIRYLIVGALLFAASVQSPATAAIAPRFAAVEFLVLPLHTMEIPRYTLPVLRETRSYPIPADVPKWMLNSRSLQNYWPAFGSQRLQ